MFKYYVINCIIRDYLPLGTIYKLPTNKGLHYQSSNRVTLGDKKNISSYYICESLLDRLQT